MKPKPLSALNHLTVPTAIVVFLLDGLHERPTPRGPQCRRKAPYDESGHGHSDVSGSPIPATRITVSDKGPDDDGRFLPRVRNLAQVTVGDPRWWPEATVRRPAGHSAGHGVFGGPWLWRRRGSG